jgi:hypothetical protein
MKLITLAGNGAVESVSLDIDRLPSALSMGLEDIDCFHRVSNVALLCNCLDREHGVDSHRGKEVIVAEGHEQKVLRCK